MADWAREALPEWIHLFMRWLHIIAGIMWLGQTWFFNWMERTFPLTPSPDPNIAGRIWMVHGGGFYHVEKQKVPVQMPGTLHWFKYEALFTWITGMLLLIQVYWIGGLLTNPSVRDLSTMAAVGLVVGLLIVSWLVYDTLVRSPIGKDERVVAAIGFPLIVAVAYGLSVTLSARAAWMHVGAMFGTIMLSNVWMRILPNQSRMIESLKKGEKPDMSLGAIGKMRSKHNTYMSVPLILIMVANHFPTIGFAADYPWIVLSALILVGWGMAKIIRDVI